MKFHHHDGHVFYYCAGCRSGHSVPVDGSGDSNSNWAWNGSAEKPTLSPSVRHFTPARVDPDTQEQKPERTLCHYFVVDGSINYLDDCAHDLRGVLPLPDFPENYGLPGLTR